LAWHDHSRGAPKNESVAQFLNFALWARPGGPRGATLPPALR